MKTARFEMIEYVMESYMQSANRYVSLFLFYSSIPGTRTLYRYQAAVLDRKGARSKNNKARTGRDRHFGPTHRRDGEEERTAVRKRGGMGYCPDTVFFMKYFVFYRAFLQCFVCVPLCVCCACRVL